MSFQKWYQVNNQNSPNWDGSSPSLVLPWEFSAFLVFEVSPWNVDGNHPEPVHRFCNGNFAVPSPAQLDLSTVAKPPWLLSWVRLVTQASKSKCSVVIWAQRFFMGMYWKGVGLLKLCSLEVLGMSSALPPPMKPSLTTFWRQVVLSMHLLGWNKRQKVWMASSFECMSQVSFSEAQRFSLYLFGHLPTLKKASLSARTILKKYSN